MQDHHMSNLGRRRFLAGCLGGALALPWRVHGACAGESGRTGFVTRGVVLVPEDLTLADWPKRAKAAGLTTIGLHHQNSPAAVVRWIESEAGQQFLEQCRTLGLQVEYELHAMKEFLPRDLFAKNPELFRMNEKGERTPDANCCVHSERGLAIIGEQALAVARALRPSTGRYFFWGDDGQAWCHCPKCRDLSPSEQALVMENRLCRSLRAVDPSAQLAHLAYHETLSPPKKVTPGEGVFLEFAPILRRYDVPYKDQHDPQLAEGLAALEANLQVFPKETAQVLEYWLDVSRFSQWKKPAAKLPWNRDVFVADVETYRKLGIRHITTFAAWIDAAYKDRFGDLTFIDEYGDGLSSAGGNR
jgi:hypothetical protein